jgi:glycosyltransferase involved in cell wall biosynthesis
MKFTVCVPTVRPTTLTHMVESIRAQSWADWELLIVGQGQDPELRPMGERMQQMDSRIRYLHLDQRGISRARNAGLRAATGDIIAMTDDDCEASSDWLETLASLFQRYPQVGFIGGALVAPRVSRWKLETCLSFMPSEALYDPSERQNPPPGWAWVGANFAFRRSVAENAGLFDECLGAGAPDFPVAEDVDYFMRLIAARVAMLATPAPVVYHTYGTRRGIRQNLRSRRAYARGNAGLDAKLTLAGNPHGRRSASLILRQGISDVVRSRRLYRLPLVLLDGLHYRAAYRQCLREYVIGIDGNLCPVSEGLVKSHAASAVS